MSPWRVPFVTVGRPGTGGRIREVPEDFEVEEEPLYEADGGEGHLFVRIEKRGLSTLEAVGRLARALGCRRDEIGFAGLKDARAVTRQTLSVAGASEAAVRDLELPGLRVLGCAPNRRKLKKGHLLGNRFRIRIRDPGEGAATRARAVLSDLARDGVPNAFGRQRFGHAGNTHRLGRALAARDGAAFFRELLLGVREGGEEAWERLRAGEAAEARDLLPPGCRIERRAVDLTRRRGGLDRALPGIDRHLRNLYLAAFQAELFNAVLTRRLDRLGTLLEGDLAWIHASGAVFAVGSPEREQPRADRLEISPSGPLFGPKTARPAGEPAAIEASVLEELGTDPARIASDRSLRGARRPLRVPLRDGAVEEEPAGGLLLAFALPPGSYATAVLREVMKPEVEEEEGSPSGPPSLW